MYYANATQDVTAHVAAFLLFREEHWYYFGSTGWMDPDFRWSKLYDLKCGKPIEPASNGPVYRRRYENCDVTLNATNPDHLIGSVAQRSGQVLWRRIERLT